MGQAGAACPGAQGCQGPCQRGILNGITEGSVQLEKESEDEMEAKTQTAWD